MTYWDEIKLGVFLNRNKVNEWLNLLFDQKEIRAMPSYKIAQKMFMTVL